MTLGPRKCASAFYPTVQRALAADMCLRLAAMRHIGYLPLQVIWRIGNHFVETIGNQMQAAKCGRYIALFKMRARAQIIGFGIVLRQCNHLGIHFNAGNLRILAPRRKTQGGDAGTASQFGDMPILWRLGRRCQQDRIMTRAKPIARLFQAQGFAQKSVICIILHHKDVPNGASPQTGPFS